MAEENVIQYTQNTWNLSRSIASAAVDVAEEQVEFDDAESTVGEITLKAADIYDEYESEFAVWPFDGLTQLTRLVEEHIGFEDDSRPINDLAKVISSRIQDDPKYEYQSETQEDDEDSQPGEASEQSRSEGPKSVEDIDIEDEYPSLAETTSEQTAKVAILLHQCFIQHERSYQEVKAKYKTPFPRRSVALTKTLNTSGETEEDRLVDIAKWVDSWLGDADQVREQNKFAPQPMGKRINS